MTMASSTSPPDSAGPSTNSGWMALTRAVAGAANRASNRRKNRSINRPLCEPRALVEVRAQPASRSLGIDTAPLRIIRQLVLADPGNAEILAVAMAEIEAGHRRSGQHGEIVGQGDARGLTAEQVEQQGLEAMVRTGRIAGRRADAAVGLADQLDVAEVLGAGIAPGTFADMLVQSFRKSLGQTVGQGLEENVRIIVVPGPEALDMRFDAMDADGESANPVLAFGIDEIGEAHVGPSLP